MIMKKIGDNSHFEFIRGDYLANYGNRIIQVDNVERGRNDGYGIFLCEVDDDNYNDKRKKGMWIYEQLNSQKYQVVCPFCKNKYVDNYDGYVATDLFNFCPNCGARLKLYEDE